MVKIPILFDCLIGSVLFGCRVSVMGGKIKAGTDDVPAVFIVAGRGFYLGFGREERRGLKRSSTSAMTLSSFLRAPMMVLRTEPYCFLSK